MRVPVLLNLLLQSPLCMVKYSGVHCCRVHFCVEQFRGVHCYGVHFCGSIDEEFIIARSIVSESIVTGSNVGGYIVARFIDPGSIV